MIVVIVVTYERRKRRQGDERTYATPMTLNPLYVAAPPMQLDRDPAGAREEEHNYVVPAGPER